jgi:hypothetical protein
MAKSHATSEQHVLWNIKMKCPICKNEMENGKLYGDRYTFKWLPSAEKLFMGIWAMGSLSIDHRSKSERFFKRPYLNGNICKVCNKIILDLSASSHENQD